MKTRSGMAMEAEFMVAFKKHIDKHWGKKGGIKEMSEGQLRGTRWVTISENK